MDTNGKSNGKAERFEDYCETILKTHLPQLDPGRPEAVEALNGLRSNLFGIARWRLRGLWNPELEADNATQEVLVRMPRIVETWKGKRPFPDAVRLSLRRICIDIWRRERRGTYADMSDIVVTNGSGIEPVDTLDAILAGLRNLQVNQRVVLVLKELYGWSAADIGRLMGISDQAVNTMNFKSRPQLRDHLRGHDGYWEGRRGR